MGHKKFFIETSNPQYSEFIHLAKYSKWVEERKKRENWEQTVDRYVGYLAEKFPQFNNIILGEIREHIITLKTLPSMRGLMSAGQALEKDNCAVFNCSYLPIDNPRSFDEIMYLLMCGTGVGFSVERQYINKLPEIAEDFHDSDTVISVPDTRIGWASSYRELISLLYAGKVPQWDTSRVRKKGSRLKTFGGRASGPEPLENLFRFTISVFKKAAGRKLTSIESHDLATKVGETVVAAGTRSSALISLSNVDDDRMRLAKSGQWWVEHKNRQYANNSAVYDERPEFEVFLNEFKSLYESKSGERGIFGRYASRNQVMRIGRRDPNHIWGCNPCSEIILRPYQMCNLTEVVVRPGDSIQDLEDKVRIATILGTLQSTFTNFRYLRKIWKRNCDEERLLGVSLTGIMDHPVLGDHNNPDLPNILEHLKSVSIETNKIWAEKLGIAQSTAITCVKPSGCRPGNALTPTNKGLLTLDELMENHTSGDQWCNLVGISVLQGNGKCSPATRTYANGESPIISIRTSYNLVVESTPNHKWFVKSRYRDRLRKYEEVNQWVRADEIKPNDILDIQLGSYFSDIEPEMKNLSSDDLHRNAVVLPRQPTHMNADLAWLLGYMFGDGIMSTSKSRLRFIDDHKFNLAKVQRILLEQFGLESNINDASQDGNASVLEKGSVHVFQWMLHNGIDKRDGLTIPRIIRESSTESIIAFIAGLIDSDGCVSKGSSGRNMAIISTTNHEFAKLIQDVCWSVGLGFGRSYNTEGKNLQRTKDMWSLHSITYQNLNSFGILKRHCNKISMSNGPWVHDADIPGALILGKVVSTEVSGVAPTYDIEVPENNWYYSGVVKSHNTASQLVDTASGIHPRFSKFYIRTVRVVKTDPLGQLMIDLGFPYEESSGDPTKWVFSFPMRSPDTSKTVSDLTAIDQLKHWKLYQDHWCEHKPSITVYYSDNEFLDVASFVWKNFDSISGISFLPKTDHVFEQAPYQPLTEEEYHEWLLKMPTDYDFDALSIYELEDSTTGSQTLACVAGSCEDVDIS